MPLCLSLAQHIPIEARFVPLLFWEQVGLWLLFWIILSIPFFLGAAVIGLALMRHHDRVSLIYAANLTGSAIGAILAPLSMLALPPQWLALIWGILSLVSTVGMGNLSRSVRWIAVIMVFLFFGIFLWLNPPEIRTDPYKYLAQVQRLESQGLVERLAMNWSPRGLIEVYGGDVFHSIPFLSHGPTPPPMHALLIDGHQAGSILNIERSSEAGVVDSTLMSFPYALISPRDVLLLGERGGLNIWLAHRQGARSIEVVQPDGDLFTLMRNRLQDLGGEVLDLPGVTTMGMDPRHHVEQETRDFDLIQIARLEGSAAGSGGVGGLGQDHLITVEGFAACLRRLRPGACLTMCRGIQTPPRDNLRLLATLVIALERIGIDGPGDHIVMVRDFLAICTMVKSTPWSDTEIALLREKITDLELTPVWFRGVEAHELNHPDELPQAPDAVGDMYYHAAKKLFSPQRKEFMDGYIFDIAPATDDRPFFLDFCRLNSIGLLKETFGELWLTRSEIAFLFVLGATILIGISGFLMTLLPLIFVRSIRKEKGKSTTAFYFASIGLGYLILEMVMLSKLTLLIGDPIYAAAVTLTSFLFFSGVGSFFSDWIQRKYTGRLTWFFWALVVVIAMEFIGLNAIVTEVGMLPLSLRCILGVAIISPMAFLMGLPMPMALWRLGQTSPILIPWAWGVNGFASVMAAPLTAVVAMTVGYRTACALASLFYLLACWLFGRLPKVRRVNFNS